MACYEVPDEGDIIECDGCGDTTTLFECEFEWATLTHDGEGWDFCSQACFWAWSWPMHSLAGERPGDPRRPWELPF
jgi:hypothetical protein